MAQIPWGVLYMGIAGYAFLTSSFPAFFILSGALTAFGLFYNSFLYPEYLTPIRHIPTPTVSAIYCLAGPSTANKHPTEPVMA